MFSDAAANANLASEARAAALAVLTKSMEQIPVFVMRDCGEKVVAEFYEMKEIDEYVSALMGQANRHPGWGRKCAQEFVAAMRSATKIADRPRICRALEAFMENPASGFVDFVRESRVLPEIVKLEPHADVAMEGMIALAGELIGGGLGDDVMSAIFFAQSFWAGPLQLRVAEMIDPWLEAHSPTNSPAQTPEPE